MGRVGVVLGIEMSRLARTGRDWHQLLELCSLTQSAPRIGHASVAEGFAS
jgi:DNA invertase Pin-like site-specific DNA recombinase